jgi:hypothetical protein
MNKNKYSDYDNYVLLCYNSKGFRLTYSHFLNFSEVKKFMKQIANVGADTFNYESDIYNKKITSADAQHMLDNLSNYNKCDYAMFKLIANQIKVPV